MAEGHAAATSGKASKGPVSASKDGTESSQPAIKPFAALLAVLSALSAIFVARVLGASRYFSKENGFVIDADPAELVWSPQTISVVLPCAGEGEFALRTVRSVHKSTPASVLREIIVVDDGSEPPLDKSHVGSDVQSQFNTKIIRIPTTKGLIMAKKIGGNAASGDIIVFFDCHVAPQSGWHAPFLRLIGENYRRLVVPQITNLDIDTWTQIGQGMGGVAKCYLTWDADFKWLTSDNPYVPVVSGGLLGISHRWWMETGGYDEKMRGWGGENIDQSLRVWLCGGEIMAANDSFVAHMWRTPTDDRTDRQYRIVGDSMINRARAVFAWSGEFSGKLADFPAFSHATQKQVGDISNIQAVKHKLGCRSFPWFIRRFKEIYEDAGLVPDEVFMLQEAGSGFCLRFDGEAGTAAGGEGLAVLASCDENDARFLWHSANRDAYRGNGCCSGLRAWNTDQCLTFVHEQQFHTEVCEVSGEFDAQYWSLPSSDVGATLRNVLRDDCAGINAEGEFVSEDCQTLPSSMDGFIWRRLHSHLPLESQLYYKARRDHPELFTGLQ